MRVEIRFDDQCKNKHNTFAITGDVEDTSKRGDSRFVAGGCLHDEIAKAFPELAPLIKWHLKDSNGPMHYIANTLYHAGDRDCWGTRKGEPRQWTTAIVFGKNPIRHFASGQKAAFVKFLQEHKPCFSDSPYDFEVLPLHHDNKPGGYQFEPKYTFGGFADKWHEAPFETEESALRFLQALQTCEPQFVKVATSFGEGKERNLAAARSTAIWPDAPDSILTAEPGVLRAALEARHPALMAEFKAAVIGAGFAWEPGARYCVDGHEFENAESNLLGDGAFPPFGVFDIWAQDYVLPWYPTRESAEAIAKTLNEKEPGQ